MFKRSISAALVFGAAALAPPVVHAQSLSCAPRDVVTKNLSDRYDEHLLGGGLQNAQSLIEIWRSSETGSFTILMTRADGMSCIVASGQNWITTTPVSAPKGLDS